MGNVEMARGGPTERSFLRKSLDKVFLGISFITLPLGVGVAASSLLAAQWGTAAIASGSAFLDFTQIKEHGRSPEQQSWYNPERLADRLIGSLRFNKTSRLAYSYNNGHQTSNN
jgi:hypothetical protein